MGTRAPMQHATCEVPPCLDMDACPRRPVAASVGGRRPTVAAPGRAPPARVRARACAPLTCYGTSAQPNERASVRVTERGVQGQPSTREQGTQAIVSEGKRGRARGASAGKRG